MTAGTVSVRGLRKSFGSTPVLEGLDLDVPDGAIVAVLGASGSGKTTLLRVLAGFERADAGTVEIGGQAVESPTAHTRADRRSVGYVSQDGSLFPHLTVRANIAFGVPRGERRGTRIGELMEMVGLTGLARRYPHELSGGQQQRVALARSLATRPRVVLLDEPFESLDANLRVSVRADVCALLRRSGTTAILVTHDQDEALSTADLVAVLRDGRIAQADAPRALYDHPVDQFVAAFVGEANLVAGVASVDTIDTALGSLPRARRGSPQAGDVLVLVRPEQLELVREPGVDGSSARVLTCEFHGHDTTVRLAAGAPGLPSTLIARVEGGFDAEVGDTVRLRVRGPVEAWPTR